MTVILRDYESFLTKKGNIKSLYIPYYVKWVHPPLREWV